jgi:hypothetical protein
MLGPKGQKMPRARGVGPARALRDDNSGVVGPATALLMILVALLMVTNHYATEG